MFKKRKFGYIEVQNEIISFVSLGEDGDWHLLESIPFADIVDKDNSVNNLSEKIKNNNFPLMIIPDFWFGNSIYPFHSHSHKVIRAFLSRKLVSEFPQASRIKDFFSYEIIKNKKGEQEVVTNFLQEPTAYKLYQSLIQNNIRPLRISSPALVWNHRLKTRIKNFNKIGTGLIYLFDGRCSLYFYFMGQFLFSRAITLPEYKEDNTQRFEIITYEMNQSIYHFSQRTKTDLDKIFLYSGRDLEPDQLSEILGRDVHMLPSGPERRPSLISEKVVIPVSDPTEILEPLKLPGVSDRTAMNEIEWKKIHLVGISIGMILLIIFGIEFWFLTNARERGLQSLAKTDIEATQAIAQYNEALDQLLNEAGKKDPIDLIGRLAASLPENIRVESAEVSTETTPGISLSGVIGASSPEDLGNSINKLIEQINVNLHSQNPLTMKDVDIERKGEPAEGYQDYHISLKLDAT